MVQLLFTGQNVSVLAATDTEYMSTARVLCHDLTLLMSGCRISMAYEVVRSWLRLSRGRTF